MIIVKMMGGLGNQMFQYATARRMAAKNNTKLLLDTTGYANMAAGDTPREFELDVYAITGTVATPEQLVLVQPPEAARSFTDKVMRKFGIGKVWTMGEGDPVLNPYVMTAPNNTYLIGWWQNEKYFEDIRDVILDEFTPKAPPSEPNQKYLDQITKSNAVAIHVRRGDYVTNQNANVFHGLAPIDYYKESIKYMQEHTDTPRFFVFSDDIAWCRENLPLGNDAVFIEGNGGKQAYEDIRLQQACKHNIIANSSFSWWGAWLNENKGKVVIAPKVWFQDQDANSKTQIVPERWVRI
ncbi:MAG TPA: alpha-1,2-fucosyltransferase [Candidatus Saccharimonadales bacterium]|nr:alpha-1,2-fucosyltransferase [Candidatus Saccharimonadales bacterium]